MKSDNYDLEERRIINYLRKNASNNENQNNIRNKILGLFYKTIDNIPIAEEVDNKELLLEFPYYFHEKTREKILELFNKEVCPKKPIKYPFDLKKSNYYIKANNYLEISNRTFRPLYMDDWKEQSEIINGISIENQQSFYNDYLRFFIKFKKFPEFNEFLEYLYYKYQMPVHKDIYNIYDNIEKSYRDIKEFIKINNLDYNFIKSKIIQSASITNRKKLQ